MIIFILIALIIVVGPLVIKQILIFNLKRYCYNKKIIILTFDDGPNKKFIEKIVILLKINNIKAHFFPLGNNVEGNRAVLLDLVKDDHKLGSHGYNHINSMKYPLKGYFDFLRGLTVINKKITNIKLYRPPYGKLNWLIIITCWVKRIKIVLWTVDSGDTFTKIPRLEYGGMILRKGGVLLLHVHHQSVERQEYVLKLLQNLIPEAKSMGYKFRTLKYRESGKY